MGEFVNLLRYVVCILLASSVAFASDQAKYNAAGKASIVRTKITPDPERTLLLRGRVMDESVHPILVSMNAMIAESADRIYLILDTPGGAVGSGMLLINAMQAAKAEKGVKVTCVIQNEAFSMGAIIQAFCNQTYIVDGSGLMFHEAAFAVQGQITKVKDYVQFVDAQLDEMNVKIAKQLGMSVDQYKARIAKEWWLTSEQAAAYGLVDGIVEYVSYPEPETEVDPMELLIKKLPGLVNPNRMIEHAR